LIGDVEMKVVSGTQEYRVNFHKVHKGKGSKVGVDTKCVISHVLNVEPKRQFNDIATGIARHNPRERYSRVLGKRIALGRALKEANLPEFDNERILKQFDVEFIASK